MDARLIICSGMLQNYIINILEILSQINDNLTDFNLRQFVLECIITIPSSVTLIDFQAFGNCSNLASITSLATTAPRIDSHTFYGVKTGGTLYVPSGSTGYNTWIGTGNYYLGKYNWTLVEQ